MESIIGKSYPKKVIPLIESAKHSIKIVVFDWRWYSNDPGNSCQLFNAAIVRASKRGVKVEACVNSESIRAPLLANGINARIPISKNLMHTKMIIIDEDILVLGSHNFSQSAFTLNFETSIIIRDHEEILKFSDFFSSLWSLNS
jgi:phosphatidylserine/phosphatidylglycerophosphate/cardiolipin synthase-like enzyme